MHKRNWYSQLEKLHTNPLELRYILFHSEPVESSIDSEESSKKAGSKAHLKTKTDVPLGP